MVLFFFDVQSYLQNINITVAWRTSLCGSPASQTYLMYEAYDQTTQSNLTPGFKPFIVSNSYLIRRKRRCENKQKRKKRTKKHTRMFLGRRLNLVHFWSCIMRRRNENGREWNDTFEKESPTMTQFFLSVAQVFSVHKRICFSHTQSCTTKGHFFLFRTQTCCLFKCSLTKNLWRTWIISCDKFKNKLKAKGQ